MNRLKFIVFIIAFLSILPVYHSKALDINFETDDYELIVFDPAGNVESTIDISGLKTLYRSQKHSFKFEYPREWVHNLSQSQNVVIAIKNERKGTTCNIKVITHPELQSYSEKYFSQFDMAEVAKKTIEKIPGAIIEESGKTFIQNRLAHYIKYRNDYRHKDFVSTIDSIAYQLHSPKKLYTITCSGASASYISDLPVIDKIVQSFIIESEHISAQDKNLDVTKKYYTASIKEFLIQFILTWIIGLLPPVFIRSLLYRKPMNKWVALLIVVFHYIFNIIFFVEFLGSQSKKHFALFLIAVVSYWILRFGYKSKKPI